MGLAVVNVFGLESFAALWPVFLVYGVAALSVAVRLSACQIRPVLLGTATLAGLAAGSLLGHMTTPVCPVIDAAEPVEPVEQVEQVGPVEPWETTLASAAERVDRRKEALADYIDENLPRIPEVLHAHCRELKDALAARGLLCIDVDPDTPRPTVSAQTDAEALALWNAYRSAKDDLDQLTSDKD